MFSLIITLISIALVVALAAATVYYGGSQFTSSTSKANKAKAVTASQQIAGAAALASTDGIGFSSVNDLQMQGYLNAVPAVDSSSIDTNGRTVTVTVGAATSVSNY